MFEQDEMVTVELPENTGEVLVYNEYMDERYAPDAGDETGHSGMHYGGNQPRHVLEGRHVYVPIPYTAWGDYCGGTVERANFRELVEQYGEYVVQVGYGTHDGQSLYLKVGSQVPALLLEIIDGLRDYPLVDDQTLSEVEMELEQEDMETWLGDEIVREIEEQQDWDDIEDVGITHEDIAEAYWELRADGVILWEAETATGGHLYSLGQAADDILQHILVKRAALLTGAMGHPELF